MVQMSSIGQFIKESSKKPKRWLLVALGWFLVALGIVGLFLPFLQGLLFIGLGVGLLSRESPTARRWLQELRERFHKLQGKEKGKINPKR